MKFHELSKLFPEMGREELDELAEDIKLNGQREPIVVYEGEVLDGKNRYLACELAGIEPKFREFNPETDGDVISYVISENVRRRHLNQGQKAMLAAQADEYRNKLEREARARKIDKMSERRGPDGKLLPSVESVPPMAKSRDLLGDYFKVSGRYVDKAKVVLDADPDLAALVSEDKTTLSKAYKEITKERVFNARLKAGVNLEGKYDIIYVDLPHDATTVDGLKEIASKVRKICKKDTMLFFWCAPQSFGSIYSILYSWEFTYRTCFVWDTVKTIQGRYMKVRHELLIVATKFEEQYPEDNSFESILRIETENGKRPEEFLRILQQMYPNKSIIKLDEILGNLFYEAQNEYVEPTNWNAENKITDPELLDYLDKYKEL